MVDLPVSCVAKGSAGFAPSPRPAALTLPPQGPTKESIPLPQNFQALSNNESVHKACRMTEKTPWACSANATYALAG